MRSKHLFLFILLSSLFFNLFAQESTPAPTPKVPGFFKNFKTATEPARFFFAPTSGILRSMEIMVSSGGFFGMENNTGIFKNFTLGLGNIAEVEFATSNSSNQISEENSTFPTSVLKASLIPEQLASYWFMPQVAVQLRSTGWRSVASEQSKILPENSVMMQGLSLRTLNISSRFTTLYFIVGKDTEYGGIHLGMSLMDIRTRHGSQWMFNEALMDYEYRAIPELKKEILAPFGGIYIRANPQTWLMAEVEPMPHFGYELKTHEVSIRRTWLGIGGVRFFVLPWLTVDAGVKYQSDFAGIADAEINLGFNLMIPLVKVRESGE